MPNSILGHSEHAIHDSLRTHSLHDRSFVLLSMLQMNLEDMLSEMTQAEKDKYCIPSIVFGI